MIEGYWYSKYEPHYPMPVEQTLPVSKEFIDKLAMVEKEKAYVESYRGFSGCRICNCLNGSHEYVYRNWNWPEGFMHYLTEHNVHPTVEFYEFIMDVNLGK